MNSLIHERHKTVISTLNQWIDQFLLRKSNENIFRPITLLSNDYILNLVTDAFDHLQLSDDYKDDQDVIKYCQNQIIRISSFDLPLLLSLESKHDHNLIIEQYYQIHTNLSFSSFINQILEQEKIPKLL